MRVLAAFLLCTAAVVGAPAAADAAAVAASDAPQVTVELDRTGLSTKIGQRFDFTSTIRNDSDEPLEGVVAHLNVLGLAPSIYVDPEDWSSERTQFVDELGAHESEQLDWEVQAVSPGALALYVTVTTRQGADDVTSSKALRVSVAQARKLNATAAAPLVLGMPAAVVLLLVLAAVRRRRLR
ncbi:hypothetical protein EV644_11181 [Kribbella orskensis]|uniref:DUF11 domain-containing protein n=1 Tax=Kribbella orskensis TaxID=2512216 RepID=A0ABY2BGC3_9ACTN|nr:MULTISPECIES: hypothetical protein [Kribbella]TCN37655.1 hypothetical protein EV642_111184 [Kribbella sp. VKM Ac-2500]TCO18843.1 hypothetical protein EV644_11181 [Kribbella orskensis]